jgi:hypothetical protein
MHSEEVTAQEKQDLKILAGVITDVKNNQSGL